jgi:hypothetical protein
LTRACFGMRSIFASRVEIPAMRIDDESLWHKQ